MSDNSDYIQEVSERCHRLLRVTSRARSQSFATTSLTMQQFRVLTLLHPDGTLSGQALSQELDVSMATVTGLVDRLVAKGHAFRAEDPTDRRVRLIGLTAEGKQEIDALLVASHSLINEFISRMTLDERQQIIKGFDIVGRIAEEISHDTDASPNGASGPAPTSMQTPQQ